MATIKSCSDLQQSKKLAEILPLESADMYYVLSEDESTNMVNFGKPQGFFGKTQVAWSLAALLSVLRRFTTPAAFSVKVSTPSLIKIENGYKLTYTGDVEVPIESVADNAIDCCVNMIIKLHEVKML